MGLTHGSQNSDLFRQQIIHNRLPTESSINVEGLLNEYYFGTSEKTDELIRARGLSSQVSNIYTKKVERYLSISLHSCHDGKNQRDPLNLVIVLDVSGSMQEHFHPESTAAAENQSSTPPGESKIEVAKQILAEFVDSMDGERERLGIVLFNDQATLLQPVRLVKSIERDGLNERIANIHAGGSTNMESGMTMAISMLTDLLAEETESRTNNHRIVFLTDALPNVGGSESCLLDLARRAAERSAIFITYIGVGLNFNSDLVYQLTRVRASNYFSVHSRDSFRRIFLTDFNYIVTPLAFNIQVFLQSTKYEIEQVFGVPEPENPPSQPSSVFIIDTYSASALDSANRIKGSMFLVKLREKLSADDQSSEDQVKVTIKYERASDYKQQTLPSFTLSIDGLNAEKSIRKAILLVQYALLIREIVRDVHQRDTFSPQGASAGTLTISSAMKADLLKFRQYFLAEMEVLDDKQMTHELDVLDRFRYAKEIWLAIFYSSST